MINFLSGEGSDRLVKRLGVLEWPPISQDLAIQDFSFQGNIKNKIRDASQPQQPITIRYSETLCENSERVQKYASRFDIKRI